MTSKPKAAESETAAKRASWSKRITEWEHSGQTQRAFCTQRGLALSTFQWWRGRANRREAVKTATPFLPMAMGAVSVVEVELRSRTRMRFEGEAALQAVAQLVARVK